MLQPDLSVFCDQSILDERGAHGAPDLLVEILSPATAYKDQTEKLRLYEAAGVREYWIVNAEAEYVIVFRAAAPQAFAKPDYYGGDESIPSEVLGADVPWMAFHLE